MKQFFLSIVLFMTNLALEASCCTQSISISKEKLDTLLLLALPASGKSEIRKYFSSLDAESLQKKYGIGEILEIDDFIYVHMMRRISEEFMNLGLEAPYFISPLLPFKNPNEWATLTFLINEDYLDIINQKIPSYSSAALWLFERLDNARKEASLPPVFQDLCPSIKKKIAYKIENEAQKIIDEKRALLEKDLKKSTIIIEFSRGGPDSASFPLPAPYGYEFALSLLDEEILQKASILYIWTTPEESRRKNEARRDPNDPGSILRHCVPLSVMYYSVSLILT